MHPQIPVRTVGAVIGARPVRTLVVPQHRDVHFPHVLACAFGRDGVPASAPGCRAWTSKARIPAAIGGVQAGA